MASSPNGGPTATPDLSGSSGPRVTDTSAKAAAAVTPGAAGLAKLVAPLAEIGAMWGVRKTLDSIYRRSTGSEPPRANDPAASLRKVLMWAAVSAAALAVVNVIIDRATARYDR
ncbi:MAG: DUF4235 domain-containing protein [Candidatus Nanopelagicales bacterium]